MTCLLEEWRDVPGFGNHYEASSLGRVRSKERSLTKRTRYGGIMEQKYQARLLNPHKERGYLKVSIGFEGIRAKVGVHTMVLLAFSGTPGEGQICRHLNGVRDDNRPSNLAWGSHLENMDDRKRHGRYFFGEKHVMALSTNETVLAIYESDENGSVLAERYGISETKVSAIRRGKSWSQVTGGVAKERRTGRVVTKSQKMNFVKAEEVRALREKGMSLLEIAALYGIDQSTVSGICRGRIWRRA